MDFKAPLKKGILLKRYKRFFVDIKFKDEIITAHLPNTGSMKTIPLTNVPCYFSTSNDPKRKLKYTLEFVETPTGLAGVNTRTPNTITHEALLKGLNKKFAHVQAEVKVTGETRIDFVLWTWTGDKIKEPKKLRYPDYLSDKNLRLHFIEVKNISMAEGSIASFPDSVTFRGTKHLNELIFLQKSGHTTQILFVVQRENIKTFTPALKIDPVYTSTLKLAKKENVIISAFPAEMTNKKVRLNWTNPIKISL